MTKKAYYFRHYANTRHNIKICKMMLDYSDEGYGMFWMILECLAEASNYRLEFDKDTIKALAFNTLVPYKTLKKFINDCIKKYKLFQKGRKYFWSKRLSRDMREQDREIKNKKEAGRISGIIRSEKIEKKVESDSVGQEKKLNRMV